MPVNKPLNHAVVAGVSSVTTRRTTGLLALATADPNLFLPDICSPDAAVDLV